jgi:peroxiredoxin
VCREELPSVNRAYSEFKDKGLEVLLVDFREDAETVKKAVRDRSYAATVLLDASGEVTGKSYGVWGPPTVFFVDRKGQLLGRAVGPRGWDSPAAKAFLRALLDLPG